MSPAPALGLGLDDGDCEALGDWEALAERLDDDDGDCDAEGDVDALGLTEALGELVTTATIGATIRE